MLRILERGILPCLERRLLLLAPPRFSRFDLFRNVNLDVDTHRNYLHELQRLRGSVYLADGAIQPNQLTPDGRHETAEDEDSWHVLILDERRRVTGCIWYLEHDQPTSVAKLRMSSSHLLKVEPWAETVEKAVHNEFLRARHERVGYAEVGGWAVSSESRNTLEGLVLILSTFSLSRTFGGALGLATATVRHSSAGMLRRLGLSSLELGEVTVPSYYDPHYECEMELLRFDTRRSSPKFHSAIEAIKSRLQHVALVSGAAVEEVSAWTAA